jgi:hypothetical protein
MQNNPNTDPTNDAPSLNEEDWQIALEPYADHPLDALSLGFRFAVLRQLILDLQMPDAIAGLDVAIECLFEHSEFRSVGRELFQVAVEGRLTAEQLDTLHELGIRV